MKILHITPHLGGGVGTVIMDWLEKDKVHEHKLRSLDYINQKAQNWIQRVGIDVLDLFGTMGTMAWLYQSIEEADIVFVHFWDHPMLAELFSHPLPACRMIFWCHKNTAYTPGMMNYPDKWIWSARVQKQKHDIWDPWYIRSTGNMRRFIDIKPVPHEGFNIGYIGTIDYKKIHPQFVEICEEIKKNVPNARFTMVGEDNIWAGNGKAVLGDHWTFTGKVDDVAPYLAEMDLFLYLLRPDHYGTSEIVLGEAMCARVPPIVMDNFAERHIVTDSKSGFVERNTDIPIDDTMYLSENRLARIKMGKNARTRARRIYSIDSMIESWNVVFEHTMFLPKKARLSI